MPEAQQDELVIGIDLGGTKALAGVVAPDGTVIGRSKVSTRSYGDAEALLTEVATCAREAAADAGVPFERIRGVGIGVPGPIDFATGVVTTAPNLGWHDVPVRDLLAARLAVPVAVDNDVRVATLGELELGAGKGRRRLVTFFVGTGIGGGLAIDGQIDHGAHGAAGEIGHTFIAPGGPKCGAGHRGCLEGVASRTAIQRDLKQAIQAGKKSVLTHIVAGNLNSMKSGDLAEALDREDKLTRRILRRAAHYLGYGIASAVNLLDPELVILGGGVVEAIGDRYTNWAIKRARPNIISVAARDLPIVRAALGDDAGMLGAALLARSSAARSPHPAGEQAPDGRAVVEATGR